RIGTARPGAASLLRSGPLPRGSHSPRRRCSRGRGGSVIAVDTSVLAYAINRHAPEHARAAQVVEDLVNGDTAWALPWSVIHELLRFVTRPHVAPRPLKASDAWGF